MTEEKRRQAAAQRCRELYEAKFGDAATSFIDPDDNAWVDTILQLDELARMVDHHFGHAMSSHPMAAAARQHILPEPKPSPVERLAQVLPRIDAEYIQAHLIALGLKLVEVDPSDDQ